jgi:hypothetical protein
MKKGMLTTFATMVAMVTSIPRFVGFCTGGDQLCDPPFLLHVETGADLQVQYFVPSSHCSSQRLHLFVDGVLVRTTGFLGWEGATGVFAGLPLETALMDLGPVSPGGHILEIQAEGQVGGCNRGRLNSWAGSLTIVASTLQFEEAVAAMQRLAEFLASLDLAAGFGANMSSPLVQAIKLLADDNSRNDMAACGALTAFQNQVEHHLRLFLPNDAARLTQQPDVIASSLGCR